MGRNGALVISAAVSLASCSPSAVVYSTETRPHSIVESNSKTRSIRAITRSAHDDRFPRCSPDGRNLVMVREGSEGRDVVLASRRSGDVRYLTRDSVADSSPAWSPDGKVIYFTRREGTHDRIARINLADLKIEFVTDGMAHDTMPAISPSGNLLVFHTYRYDRETELQLLDLRNGETRRVTMSPGSDYEVSFVDEMTLVFSSNRDGGHYRIYSMGLGDKDARLLADTGNDAWGPRYSARHKKVLFYSGRAGSRELWEVAVAGSSPRRLGLDGYGGDWCPN